MREIHFRGICKDSKRWAYGYYVHFEDFSRGINYHGICSGYYNTHFEVIPETVGQYTGLTDKNGTRVFEGDIVKTKYGRLCEVRWISSPCSQCWDLIPIEATQKAPDSYDVWASKNLEVVGNVHDGGAYD